MVSVSQSLSLVINEVNYPPDSAPVMQRRSDERDTQCWEDYFGNVIGYRLQI